MTRIDAAASAPRDHRARANHKPWVLVALVVLLIGLGASAAGGLLWRGSVRRDDRQQFVVTAAGVTEALETLLLRDADFVATMRSVLTIHPHLTDTDFNAWYDTLNGRDRQVGSLGTAIVESVPAVQLAQFQARRNADPMFRALVGGNPIPIHRGRDRYCVLAAGGAIVPVDSATSRLMQTNWCDPGSVTGKTQISLLAAATDTSENLAEPTVALGLDTMFLESAYYRRGAPVSTVAQRRVAVRGWVVSSFDLTELISRAIGSDRGLEVALYHRNPGYAWVSVGDTRVRVPAGSSTRTAVLAIDGDWKVTVRGTGIANGLSADTQGALVFAGGALVSVLLFLLLLVLTRSRERALAMVAEKTGQLRHQALHDALTDLPNRVLALDRAEQMLARARRAERPAAALYLDVDGFKHVNDTFGHAAGDEILREIAGRLRSVIRESDTAARLSGDEFVVLLDNLTVDAGVELVAERLLNVVREPYEARAEIGRRLSVTASIGVAYGLHGTAEGLLAEADTALYVAKSSGKNGYVVFEPGMETAAQDRLRLEMDLATALADGELFLVYQPTFELQSERAIGVEALLRWQHPDRGLIMPDVFIPIAEESGMIVPIGRWVLEQACRQGAIWRARGHALGISVNVSARQLDDDELIEDVRGALRDSGLDAAALTLEITETTLMRDADATVERLVALKDLGLRVAIDDFGAGYSSLAYLRKFPVDSLKIDRSFIQGVAGSRRAAGLMHALVRLGKTLKLETLAEGIEDRSQLLALQHQHCDQGQGFLFARPLEADAIEQFLDTHGSQRIAS